MDIVQLWKNCSSCVGFCVSLGKTFLETGVREIDEVILPHLAALANDLVVPRVLPSYAILYWFSLEVSHDTMMFIMKYECTNATCSCSKLPIQNI